MDVAQAKNLCDAFRDLIKSGRNPVVSPEFHKIMRDLYLAAAYFDAIPLDQLTLEEENIVDEIDKILMRD
jgi:hypothetical protein